MTETIQQLAADIFTRTVADAEAESKQGPWFAPAAALVKKWDVAGCIAAECSLVCDRFGCTESEWYTDHDRFSGVREQLHAAVESLRDEWISANG